jgi:hypothetical protein
MLGIIAHVMGVPVEETALAFAPVFAAAAALTGGFVRAALRRRGERP